MATLLYNYINKIKIVFPETTNFRESLFKTEFYKIFSQSLVLLRILYIMKQLM